MFVASSAFDIGIARPSPRSRRRQIPGRVDHYCFAGRVSLYRQTKRPATWSKAHLQSPTQIEPYEFQITSDHWRVRRGPRFMRADDGIRCLQESRVAGTERYARRERFGLSRSQGATRDSVPRHGRAVDQSAKTFAVAGKETSRTFKVTDKTTITKDGEASTLRTSPTTRRSLVPTGNRLMEPWN